MSKHVTHSPGIVWMCQVWIGLVYRTFCPVQLAHTKALEVRNVKYPIPRVETKVISVPKGNLTVTQDNLFLGQLPHHIVVSCVDSAAFNGNLNGYPFNFQHHDIAFIAVFWDGKQVPSKPFSPDFDKVCMRGVMIVYSPAPVWWTQIRAMVSPEPIMQMVSCSSTLIWQVISVTGKTFICWKLGNWQS